MSDGVGQSTVSTGWMTSTGSGRRLDPASWTGGVMDDVGQSAGLVVSISSDPPIPADGPRRGGFGVDVSNLVGQRFDLFLYLTTSG